MTTRLLRPLLATVGLLSALALGGQTGQAQNTVRKNAASPAKAISSVASPHGASLQEACATCHRADGWKPARIAPTFQHAEKTFPLTGAHVRTTCLSCHKSLEFRGAQTSCASCHTDTHNGELGTTCQRCHNTRSFIDRAAAVRTHEASRFPLRGAHALATCESCHQRTAPGQQRFLARNATCASCHMATFQATTSPAHASAKFSTDCTTCHTISSWSGATFDHATTRFPLTGRHQVATCASCHADKVFAGKSMACNSCHAPDAAKATTPRHEGFPTACESCHTTSGWPGAKFDHDKMTTFALTGGHRTVSCAQCHADKVYKGKPSTCVSCHQGDFSKSNNPDHAAAKFSTTCETCHTTTVWKGAQYDHSKTQFPLTGRHVAATCLACHADKVYGGKASACASCHQKDATAARTPPHAGFPAACESCHTTTAWQGAKFDHNTNTSFALHGAHQQASCAQCHNDGVFKGKPTTCVSCHQARYDATVTPNHKANGIPTTCERCHSTSAWKPGLFDHSSTRFPLTGAHVGADCASCHKNGVTAGTSTACASCHQSNYDATTQPHHKEAKFGTTCETCHTTGKWLGVEWNHNTQTRFPLLGRHVAAACLACHSDRVYAGKPSVCQTCHQKDYDAAQTPNHRGSGFPTTCETCHSVSGWQPSSFNHDATAFPLQGGHKTPACSACHGDGVFKGKPTACVSCHQTKFDATSNPNHRSANFSTACASCHSVNGWKPANFDHNITRFPLTGAHRTATCLACHKTGTYTGTPSGCASCHQTKFDATTNPNHKTAGFPTTCQQCHTTTAWTPATFDHNATRFPLTGGHRTATCASCHKNGTYTGTSSACASCHQTKFDATTNPNHKTAGFPTTCQQCHTTTAWTPATFDHNATRFPLTGGHRTAACAACHTNGTYTGTTTACVGCHQARFDATTTPNHKTSGFPTVCQSCHTTTAWTPATFDHNATAFPLTGLHKSVSCASCHGDGVYKGKTTACSGCHLTRYNATSKPAHQANGIGTTCQTCHTTNGWTPATYDHGATRFPLAGAHRAVSCAGCHGDGVYRGKSMLCSSCHLPKYNATTNPNHKTSGFPTTCETCHTATAWTPATFNHDATLFPLTGLHRTVSCASCHGDGIYKGKTTACSGCHLPKYNATTKPAHAANGIGTTCQTCHTTSGWIPGTYDHNATAFPLTGAHKTVACGNCHGTGVYRGTSKLCASCHLTKYNTTTNPNHKTASFPTTCETCHTTTTWTGAKFAHDGWFPIYSGKHNGRWSSCADCHANNANYKEFTCLTCHTKTKTDSDHRGRSGYSYTSAACYSCHPRGSS